MPFTDRELIMALLRRVGQQGPMAVRLLRSLDMNQADTDLIAEIRSKIAERRLRRDTRRGTLNWGSGKNCVM